MKIGDIGSNKKLVIGVRAYNYLVTAGFNNGNIRVGPGRCAEGLEVNDRTRLFVKSDRQDPNMLTGDILSFGQLRSKFGNPSTYLGRRSALVGYASVPVMPVTIFTLSQFGVPFSEIFRHLAASAKPGIEKNVTIRLDDITAPPEDDKSIPAKITRKIIQLFSPGIENLIITGNKEAEKALMDLANHFSGTISNKNLTIQHRIERRILG